MGTTGAANAVESNLPSLVSRIRSLSSTPTPLAVGFGVSTPAHFNEVGALADGVVIGSKLLSLIKDHSGSIESLCSTAQNFCEEICGGKTGRQRVKDSPDTKQVKRTDVRASTSQPDPESTRFGEFGGQYVPESLVDCLVELEACHLSAKNDPAFQAEFQSYYGYMNRPSNLYYAKRLTEKVGGCKIWFKREDLNHTGSHKINNAVGQVLLAMRLKKKRIIAETGAGQHGVATATVCAKFGLECVIYMGAEDVRRQALNVFRMKMLGAKVVAVSSGSQTLKDAIS